MTMQLQVLAMYTLLFILAVFTISSITRIKPKEKPKKEKKRNAKSDEVIDTLDWMLVNGIIDHKEYNRLMGKCLQFLP